MVFFSQHTHLVSVHDIEYTMSTMEVEKRKLIKFSNYSLCITLPKWLLRKLEWDKGDEVTVEVDEANGRLIVSKKIADNNTLGADDSLRW